MKPTPDQPAAQPAMTAADTLRRILDCITCSMSYTRASAAKMIAIIESYADARLAAVTAERDAAKAEVVSLREALDMFGILYNTPPLFTDEKEWRQYCNTAVKRMCFTLARTSTDYSGLIAVRQEEWDELERSVQIQAEEIDRVGVELSTRDRRIETLEKALRDGMDLSLNSVSVSEDDAWRSQARAALEGKTP